MIQIIDYSQMAVHIDSLQTLYNSWMEEAELPMDVAESGGVTIAQIEELGATLVDMREAFVLLMERTISYMEKRKKSFEELELYLITGVMRT